MNISLINKKFLFLWLYYSSLLRKYIFGYVLKDYSIFIYVKAYYFFKFIFIGKKHELISLCSLLDIVVVDVLSNKNNNRFLISYIFLNYIKEFRISIKFFNDGLSPIFSLSNLYKSSI